MENKLQDTIQRLGEKINRKKIKNQFFLLLITLFVGFALGVYVCMAKPERENSKTEPVPIVTTVDDTIVEENYTLTIGNVQEVLKPAGELISTKYYYTDADTYENYKELFGTRIPFTTDKVVFTYEGVISVGIDLSAIECEVDNEKQIISITLPELKILSHDIDESSFEFPYMSNSVFNATEMDDYVQLLGKLEQKKENELTENTEFMNDARANTQEVLKQFLITSDITKEYDVVFK